MNKEELFVISDIQTSNTINPSTSIPVPREKTAKEFLWATKITT
jgi:hypothetical protein